MSQVWQGRLEKIDNYRWRIPTSYKPGMKVPGLIYASESLIPSILKDKALDQVANVAFLPGIVKYSLAMPDIHWGYGFCLTKDAKILTNLGFFKAIKDFETDWPNQILKGIDLESIKTIETPILRFIKLEPKEIFIITTKNGYEIKTTEDHPLFTPLGMKPVREVSSNDKVAIFPFHGVPYKRPSCEIIISEKDIEKTLLKIGIGRSSRKFQINLQKLKKRNLLPLTYGHPKIPYILKIMAFIFGDGSMNFIGKKGDGILHFSGKPEDLEEVRRDLEKIGYTPSPIHLQRKRSSKKNPKYYNSYSFFVNASSLVFFLETLGVPRGTKVSQPYRIPQWIFKATLWQKRLFLASLFGCELRMPHRRLDRRGYFNAPVFPMHKREGLIRNGKDFLSDIAKLLKEFGVTTLDINKRKKHTNTKGDISWALELLISPKPENLFNLWSKIGFEYNSERSFKANLATHYLKLKQKILKEKEEAIKIKIPQLLKYRLSYQKIAFQLAGNPLTKRFIIDVCCKLKKGKKVAPRIPTSFPLFEEYMEEVTRGLGHSGMVWDIIEKIQKIPYKDSVYDFTVSHSDHNFIANNFVVSNCIGGVAATDPEKNGVISPGGVGYDINCGVRLVRSDLEAKDIKPRLEKLVNSLFNSIPCGVGSTGEVRVSDKEEKEILIKGSAWAIKKGYGVREDLETTENRGCMEDADPGKVSDRAYERGRKQTGTLGAGNHFLEIQEVDEIYDERLANIYGLFKGQVTVMIHCGSRGFGHQVCDDYVKGMVHTLHKYNIDVPDRQLACAPVDSPEGKAYLGAMRCAVNYAWANRQVLMHLTRVVFEGIFNKSWSDLGLCLVYDVAHNVAKIERHKVNGKEKTLCIHRKGATRAFPPGHPDVPERYKDAGQPVIIPGDMGTHSYLLAGTQAAMEESFGSTCHGAGRCMSRSAAIRQCRGRRIDKELLDKSGILVRAKGRSTLAEEAPEAYKDVEEVVNVVHEAGISKKVARMKPLGVIKG